MSYTSAPVSAGIVSSGVAQLMLCCRRVVRGVRFATESLDTLLIQVKLLNAQDVCKFSGCMSFCGFCFLALFWFSTCDRRSCAFCRLGASFKYSREKKNVLTLQGIIQSMVGSRFSPCMLEIVRLQNQNTGLRHNRIRYCRDIVC